ncbi:hypothetical protein [Paenibacillus pedocola]|uniref:hypothetical protein n=1 Tax=Paenibacillus pedocola TaxID=3242193 RepID=UPI00287811A4|nr:hypothetical protein [Paenibacillus typhae]
MSGAEHAPVSCAAERTRPGALGRAGTLPLLTPRGMSAIAGRNRITAMTIIQAEWNRG